MAYQGRILIDAANLGLMPLPAAAQTRMRVFGVKLSALDLLAS